MIFRTRCFMFVPDRQKRRFFRLFQMLDGNDILPQAKYFDLLRRADVFVRPEKHTPAMGYVEAMDFGLPIIDNKTFRDL